MRMEGIYFSLFRSTSDDVCLCGRLCLGKIIGFVVVLMANVLVCQRFVQLCLHVIRDVRE